MTFQRAWLVKSEPESYGIDALKADKKTPWEGVRNFQARNYMRDDMKMDDPILFYHSSCAEPGIYGLGKVASNPYPDQSQFNDQSPYYDPKATKQAPIWFLVDVGFKKKLKKPILLSELRANPKLRTLETLKQGSRLSITSVTPEEYKEIERLAL